MHTSLVRIANGWRKVAAHAGLPMAQRIVLGAGRTSYPGWYATDRDTLDVTERSAFARYWRPGTRVAFLSEHVWEHLTLPQAARANANCFEFLRAGGWLRIAVPDGLHPDAEYRRAVAPGGHGCGAQDHKVLYDYRLMRDMLHNAGYHVTLLEYWDEYGAFHFTPWNADAGRVRRSKENDPRNRGSVLRYTSLIVDAVRPAGPTSLSPT
jgi:predicted SAM-dependent methyltransferase